MKHTLLFIGNPHSAHDVKITRWFAAQGHRVLFGVYELPWARLTQDQKKNFAENGVELVGPMKHYSRRNFLRRWKQLRWLNQLITTSKVEAVVILYLTPSALWANHLSEKVPVILFAYGTDVNENLQQAQRKEKELYQKAFLHASATVAFSSALLQKIKEFQPGVRNTEVIRSGVDCHKLLQGQDGKLPGDLEGKKYILFPRYMEPVYVHELSVEAIGMLDEKVRKDLTFVFIGSDSIYKDYAEDIRNKMKSAQAHFLFLPAQSQENIWALMRHASLCVMHPRTDGSPVSAMETMLLKTPLLLGAASYDEDLFEEVPRLRHLSADEIAMQITQLLENPPHPDRLEKWSRKIAEKADREKEMQKLLNVIQIVLHRMNKN